jgi:hypothetical protein
MRLIRQQQTYVAVAGAIYAALWAADRPVPIGSTLIYTVSLCNLILFMQDYLVGGDYYDVIKLSETKLGICIADVVGKSVSAALYGDARRFPYAFDFESCNLRDLFRQQRLLNFTRLL